MLRSKNAPHPVQDTGLVFMGRLAGLYASVLWKNPTRLGYSSSPMDYNYLSCRVKALQKELGEIALQCAGINRHEAENGKFLRGRSSDPLGPKFCVGYREVHSEA